MMVMNVEDYLAAVMVGVSRVASGEIERAAGALRRVREEGGMVWVVGNGGSAATASHFANDLVKACGVRAIALSDQTPTVLAYGNDEGWEGMFSGALNVLAGRQGGKDVLVAISTSGSSPNVVRAAEGFGPGYLIVLTGPERDSNVLGASEGVVIRARHKNIRVQEDVHMAVCHAIVSMLGKG